MQFLKDIKKVYPGFVNGEIQDGLELKSLDPPTAESENISEFMPKQINSSIEDEKTKVLMKKKKKKKTMMIMIISNFFYILLIHTYILY